jgi:hypothetical protein
MPRRRPIIRSPRRRLILRAVAVGMLCFAIFTCLVRILWLWDSTTPAGGTISHTLGVEHGVFMIEYNTSPWPLVKPPGPLAVNRQIDLGVSFEFLSYSQKSFPVGAGTPGAVSVVRYEIGLAMFLGIAASLLFILTFRVITLPPGECECGYDLRNLTSSKCPECGAAIEPHTPAPVV